MSVFFMVFDDSHEEIENIRYLNSDSRQGGTLHGMNIPMPGALTTDRAEFFEVYTTFLIVVILS